MGLGVSPDSKSRSGEASDLGRTSPTRTRVDRNLTNVQVAHMLGVADQTVERWKNNRNRISPKSRLKIIAFIGYDPEAETCESNR